MIKITAREANALQTLLYSEERWASTYNGFMEISPNTLAALGRKGLVKVGYSESSLRGGDRLKYAINSAGITAYREAVA